METVAEYKQYDPVDLAKVALVYLQAGLDEQKIKEKFKELNIDPDYFDANYEYALEDANRIIDYHNNWSEELYNELFSDEHERFNLKSVYDLFKPKIRKEFIIDGLIRETSVNLWFGRYGHKKTFVALSAAINVAAGRDWLGLRTKQSSVLFINEDSDPDTLEDRLEAGLRGESLEKENLRLFFISLADFNFLKNPDDIDHLKAIIEKTNAKLVFIDALDNIAAGYDENSVKDLQPLFIALRKLSVETQSSIVILHHSNKRGDIRGSTAIPGGADSSIKIESENGSAAIKITTDKMRVAKDFKKRALITYVSNQTNPNLLDRFYIVEDDSTPFDEEINDKQREIIEFMQSNNNLLAVTEFLARFADAKEKQSYRNAIYKLRDKKLIQKSEQSKHNYTVFSLV